MVSHARHAGIDETLANYRALAKEPHESGDWTIFPRVFTEAGAVVMQVYNRLVISENPDLEVDLVNWTRIEYGGNGPWRYEKDIYNPLQMRKVFDEWVAAGGKPHVPLMGMRHGPQ